MSGIIDRLNLYLQDGVGDTYKNTEHEQVLVDKFETLYELAKAAQQNDTHCNPDKLNMWRKAYKGTLNALKADGSEESKRRSRQLRKMCYEIVESIVDNSVPLVKIQPRYKEDIPLVGKTEEYLKFEMDRILTRYENDRSERAVYVDGTGWYKVWWDSLDNTNERSGDVRLEFLSVDQVIPQPGVRDWKQLEYVFEVRQVPLTRIWDLYHRHILPINETTNVINVVSCYYLNEDRIVGLFMWSPESMQVICNEKDWQIRKIRTCTKCQSIVPQSTICPTCGNKTFRYENATEDILDEDLMEIYNPYEVGETDDESKKGEFKAKPFLTKGTKIPFYRLHQLPFVPRPATSDTNSIYGISQVSVVLDMQDSVNKVLTKAIDKTLKSGAVVTKSKKSKIADTDETFKVLDVTSPEEAQMLQTKQIIADTTQDITLASIIYDSGKASSGVTDSFQGRHDSSATSGKAKQYSAMQTAGRIESLRVMKSSAMAAVYELVFKYLLAFSDETRHFVRVLPDGKTLEQSWSKYNFLARNKYGEVYYRDDFHFDTDVAASLSQNRQLMWQETQDKFVQGAFGNPADTRTLKLFWNVMDSLQYPLAKCALAGIEETERHLPEDLEQALMSDPDALQAATSVIAAKQEHRGGARDNSGPTGNGATHAANVERTNERNRASNRDTAFSPQMGGSQGGNT